jgi:hypothetical protein
MNLIRFVCLLAWLLAGAVHAAPLKIYGMDSGPISFLNGSRPDGYAVELAQAIQRGSARASRSRLCRGRAPIRWPSSDRA